MNAAALRKQFTDLMRTRSADTATWQNMWREAGAESGILEEMTPAQLEALIRQARALPTTKASRQTDRKGMEEWP